MTQSPTSTSALDDILDDLKTTRRAEGDDGTIVDIDPYAVPGPAAELLQQAAQAVHADGMLEIGIASGLSTLSICCGCLMAGPMREASFHAIDPCHDHFCHIGLHAIRRAGVEHLIRYHPEPSHVALPRILEAGTRLQFVFVDGIHQLDSVLMELFLIDQMLDRGGVIAVHDMWMPGLQHAVSYWLANRDYEPVVPREGSMLHEPCPSEKRGCGAPERRPEYFRSKIEPFVDWSVLFMRKCGGDQRVWDFFADYA